MVDADIKDQRTTRQKMTGYYQTHITWGQNKTSQNEADMT